MAGQTETIVAAILTAIEGGSLRPGGLIDEQELIEAHGVSRTPVREAIRQLEAIGLAVARPHRGAVVAPITGERLDEMFAVLGELEAVCARECATRMTGGERSALSALHERMRRAVRDGELEAYAGLNDSFHDAIGNGSSNGFLTDLTLSVRARLQPFRKAQFYASLERLSQSWAEHDRVVTAILQGSGPAAENAMRDHIRTSRRNYDV
ncbi:MAG TPA: GntR family transcriptional regulator, partial [Paracoccaceae bacterium]